MAQVGLQRADIALVTVLAGPAAAALYTAVTRFLVLGQLATSALQQVSEPHLAKLLAKGNRNGAKLVTQQLTLWTILLAWPIYLFFVIYAEQLLSIIFGTEYAAGADSLRLLSIAMLFSTGIGPLDMLLLMAGRSSLSLINTATALVLDIVGCLLLVPIDGYFGAATAWTVSIVVRNMMCFCRFAGP
nr:polysaccharide biosynthesis C-terminal domain-containing protein [Arthrobacter polaris]